MNTLPPNYNSSEQPSRPERRTIPTFRGKVLGALALFSGVVAGVGMFNGLAFDRPADERGRNITYVEVVISDDYSEVTVKPGDRLEEIVRVTTLIEHDGVPDDVALDAVVDVIKVDYGYYLLDGEIIQIPNEALVTEIDTKTDVSDD